MTPKYLPLTIRADLSDNLRTLRTGKLDKQDTKKKLGELLQAALELEFSTIPIYLSAAFSLNQDNKEIQTLIMRIAKEEMLHMTVVANLMNAIGVAPGVRQAVPSYPYDLTVLDPPLRLDLESFSFTLVERLFMQIETPEDPVEFPVLAADAFARSPETIGQFYEGIIDIIKTTPDLFEIAEQSRYKQIKVSPNFRPIRYKDNSDNGRYPLPKNINFVITNQETAIRHLEWVVSEGEGTSPFDPLDAEGLPGHFYRFESILKGLYLILATLRN